MPLGVSALRTNSWRSVSRLLGIDCVVSSVNNLGVKHRGVRLAIL